MRCRDRAGVRIAGNETMALYGYVRVSSRDQNEDRQIIALNEFSGEFTKIFLDKQSGKDFNRPEYLRMLKLLREGDTAVIKSIDRLGRNYDEILREWRIITKEIRADIVVLDMPLLDTRVRERDLTGVFISDIVLQILSYVAQTERESIRQRQAEGIRAAKQRGVRFGARRKEMPPEFDTVWQAWLCGLTTARGAARELSMATGTFLARARERAQEYTCQAQAPDMEQALHLSKTDDFAQ